nr:MAG TPA: hypothetical protein [Caudoviricetes sp.]
MSNQSSGAEHRRKLFTTSEVVDLYEFMGRLGSLG